MRTIPSSVESSLCMTASHVLGHNVNIVAMLLLLSGDVETNPGPGKLGLAKKMARILFVLH